MLNANFKTIIIIFHLSSWLKLLLAVADRFMLLPYGGGQLPYFTSRRLISRFRGQFFLRLFASGWMDCHPMIFWAAHKCGSFIHHQNMWKVHKCRDRYTALIYNRQISITICVRRVGNKAAIVFIYLFFKPASLRTLSRQMLLIKIWYDVMWFNRYKVWF